jgi:hypothetical protein
VICVSLVVVKRIKLEWKKNPHLKRRNMHNKKIKEDLTETFFRDLFPGIP